MELRARVRNGILEPLQPLNLPDGTEVTVLVPEDKQAFWFEKSFGGWKDFDADSFLAEIRGSRALSRPEPRL